MKILLIGADGQLGTDLAETLRAAGHEIDASVVADLDVTDRCAVMARVTRERHELVINTAAYTHVDKCESDHEACFRVNAFAVHWLALACNEVDAALVQISTDYVFDGAKRAPYTEDDAPNPQSVYAISKLAGEQFARYARRWFIIRTSGLYGRVPSIGKGYNFVEKVLQLAREKPELTVVNDEVLTPTFTLDVARNLAALIETEHYGLYHMTNEGQCSWFEFAAEIFRLAGVDTPLQPIPAATWPSPARRPAYSVLDNANLRRIGLDRMPPWQTALREYLRLTGRM